MKNLFLLACLFYIQSSLAVAPYGIKGQAQSQTLYSNVHQFPNQNVTNIGGINALVYDSGLIFDGGFESATAFQGHTLVSGSTYFSVVTAASDVLDGKKTARVTCFNAAPSGVCKIEQTVNLGTARLNGFPMLLSVRVESSPDQPLTFCAKIDGVEKDCVTGYKGYLTISTQAGATSVGYTLSKNEYVSPLTSLFDSIKVEITETVTNAPVVGPRVQYTPTLTNLTGTTSCFYSQEGPWGIIDCSFTATANGSAGEARISFPSGWVTTNDFSGTRKAGEITESAIDAPQYVVLYEPNVSYLTFGLQTTGTAGLTKLAGSSLIGSGTRQSFTARVPIAGLASSVPTYSDRCRDPRNCETVFSAKISSAGVVSEENLDWINGNAGLTDTSLYALTFNASFFSSTPNCTVTPSVSIGNLFPQKTSEAASGLSVRMRVTSTLANTAGAFDIICQRQGQDYINAKVNQIVGSFKDYVKTPNTATGKVGFCSAKISATGVISDQLGGCFASCTNATTPVCTFTTNYWRSGSVPNCWAQGSSTSGATEVPYQDSTFISSSSYGAPFVGLVSGVVASGARKYFCHGEIQ